MDRLEAPVFRKDQIRPFTDEQILVLTTAGRPTRCTQRDVTILWLLYDTGVRVSELCDLRRRDLDMAEKRITITSGKGDKARVVYFGRYATKALWDYLRETWRYPAMYPCGYTPALGFYHARLLRSRGTMAWFLHTVAFAR